MSLKEVYTLAHTAQCRLNIAASRPDRNLRFVVGHLMHYESLRLRIVEIEHDISRAQRATAVQFKGTGHVDHRLQHKTSTGSFARKSPPPYSAATTDHLDDDDDEDDEDDTDEEDEEVPDDIMYDDDEDDDGLSLQRFPSGSARPPQPPPDLEPDNPMDDDSDEDEPPSPDEPDAATLESVLKGDGSGDLAKLYESVRKCRCHGETDAPSFDRLWELPDDGKTKDGRTRAVAQVAVAAT